MTIAEHIKKFNKKMTEKERQNKIKKRDLNTKKEQYIVTTKGLVRIENTLY